ncbi:MAG: TonB-dependent receptor plug domain-containing protein [Sedimentisphaerales bacterium]|nr:TonB-dependent receptor plug domain-containing protein [Sedimentisphaerales bacterium]
MNVCTQARDANEPMDFFDRSIEKLMNIEVTSRGFSDLYNEKLLVLIDGRSVYTPLFAGVYWEVQVVGLEAVERIEVVRGPGETLWGVNADNGIIHVITKNAKQTQGTLLRGGFGSEEKDFSTIRYGGQLDDRTYYRVCSKYFNRDTGKGTISGGAADDTEAFRAAFRLDSDRSERDHVTVQGNFYNGYSGQKAIEASLTAPYMRIYDESIDISSRNILTRWTSQYSDMSHRSLQIYYDRTERDYEILDVTGYYHEYDHRYSLENYLTAMTRIYDNRIYGETYGGEISAHWQVRQDWKLTAGYGFVQIQSHGKPTSMDETTNLRNEQSSPHNTFHLRSYIDLPGDCEFDTMVYYVDNVPFHDIPRYLRLDARLDWHLSENMEVSRVVQNLFGSAPS